MDETETETVETENVSAGVETVEAEQRATEAQTTEAAEPKTEVDEQKRARRRSFDERINQITRKMHEERERADLFKRKYEETVKIAQSNPLKREAFRDDDSFIEAVEDRRVKIKTLETLTENAVESINSKDFEHRQAIAESWSEAVADVVARIPDWQQVVASSRAPTTQVMDQTIMESDVGPEIAYYLAKHPGEAVRIAGLSQHAQIRELVRLESKVSQAEQPTKSSAPSPIKPIASTAKAVPSSADDYRRWEAEQNKKDFYGTGRR